MEKLRKNKTEGDEDSIINDETMDEIMQEEAADEEILLNKKGGFLSGYKSTLKSRAKSDYSFSSEKKVVKKIKSNKIDIRAIEEDLVIKETSKAKAETIYLKIKEWRSVNKAVVDTQGAEHHYNPKDSQNEQAFQVMVGVLLSVQSNDVITDKIMQELLKDPEGVYIQRYADLTELEIKSKISKINLNGKKAKYIKKAAEKILGDFKGIVPQTLKELTSFYGIGPKVAHLILQIAFNKTTGVAVDTHVHRISNRLGFVKFTRDAKKTMVGLQEKFDKKYWEEINITLVGFGQLHCAARKPKCDSCPVQTDCALGKKLLEIEDLKSEEKLKYIGKVPRKLVKKK